MEGTTVIFVGDLMIVKADDGEYQAIVSTATRMDGTIEFVITQQRPDEYHQFNRCVRTFTPEEIGKGELLILMAEVVAVFPVEMQPTIGKELGRYVNAIMPSSIEMKTIKHLEEYGEDCQGTFGWLTGNYDLVTCPECLKRMVAEGLINAEEP